MRREASVGARYRSDVPNVLNRAVARILDTHRLESSMSQRELALKTGIGQSTVSRVLRCETPMTFDQFEALCKALRLDASDILAEASRR